MLRTLTAVWMVASTLITAVPASAEGQKRRTASATTTTAPSRVYDPYRRDRHVWDTREQRAYREYLAEHRRAYIAYRRTSLAERRAYWRWRHAHAERIEHERR